MGHESGVKSDGSSSGTDEKIEGWRGDDSKRYTVSDDRMKGVECWVRYCSNEMPIFGVKLS